MKTILITSDSIQDPDKLIETIRSAFNNEIPPVWFSFERRDVIEAFTKAVRSDNRGFYGKRALCHHAKNAMQINLTANEVFTLSLDKYPVSLGFKSIGDLEDFAVGYTLAAENAPGWIPAPSEEAKAEDKSKKAVDTKAVNEKIDMSAPRDSIKEYPVNPLAESIMDTILKISVFVGWIFAILAVVIGIFWSIETSTVYWAFIGIIAGAIILILYYSAWALNKVIVNISRNLFNINEQLKR